MTGFIIFIHTIICILLTGIILIQSGKGGGLTENFAAAESMFGAKTNIVLVKATAVMAALFLITCFSLAAISSRKGKSLMTQKVSVPQQTASSVEQQIQQAADEIKQKAQENIIEIQQPAAESLGKTDEQMLDEVVPIPQATQEAPMPAEPAGAPAQ